MRFKKTDKIGRGDLNVRRGGVRHFARQINNVRRYNVSNGRLLKIHEFIFNKTLSKYCFFKCNATIFENKNVYFYAGFRKSKYYWIF